VGELREPDRPVVARALEVRRRQGAALVNELGWLPISGPTPSQIGEIREVGTGIYEEHPLRVVVLGVLEGEELVRARALADRLGVAHCWGDPYQYKALVD